MYHQVLQCLQSRHFSEHKISTMYREGNIAWLFCESLRVHAVEMNNFKQKKLTLLTNEQLKSNENATKNYIYKKIEDKHTKDKIHYKSSTHSTYNMKYNNIPKPYSGCGGQKARLPPTSFSPVSQQM